MVEEHLSWPLAKNHCLDLGGNLASIRDGLTQTFLLSLLTTSLQTSTWIGGFIEHGTWKWSDNSEFNYTNWDTGHQSMNLSFMSMTSNGQWIEAETKRSFICQYNIDGSCFKEWDGNGTRVFPYLLENYEENTIERCIKHCSDNNYPYAGVWWTECACGVDLPPVQVSDDECDEECPGNESQRCGGSWRINVYKTIDNEMPIYVEEETNHNTDFLMIGPFPRDSAESKDDDWNDESYAEDGMIRF